MNQPENNPHFSPQYPLNQSGRQPRPPGHPVQPPRSRDPHHDKRSRPRGSSSTYPSDRDRQAHSPFSTPEQNWHYQQPHGQLPTRSPHDRDPLQPHGLSAAHPSNKDRHQPDWDQHHQQSPDQRQPHGPLAARSPGHDRRQRQTHGTQPQQDQRTSHVRVPVENTTHPLAWFIGVFCAIFWVVIILGGLIILIFYLAYRPKSPQFHLSSASLNAAYLDMGYLLNADMNLLANFTNPNKKVSVDFISMVISVYYGQTQISTQYVEPFSAAKRTSMLQNVHMVSSQVRLPILESQRLQKQMGTDGIIFQVKGFFRARSNFGGFLKYSYWLHSDCNLIVAPPPGGVLIRSQCRTKR